MKLTRAELDGVFIIDIDPQHDERGFFARTFCTEQFAAAGLETCFLQHSISWNPHAGTLRGLHFQAAPHAEHKLVRVTRGGVFDVVVDLRRGTPGFGQWQAVELSAENRRQLYIPPGVAHGFQTLLPDTELLYQISTPFHDASVRGVRWDDAALGIAWPACDARLISQRDRALPDLAACLQLTLTG